MLQSLGVGGQGSPAKGAHRGGGAQPSLRARSEAAGALAQRVSGLSNEAGEYNCFLNAIIQCLWHCADFRRQVLSWPAVLRESGPVLRALHRLFAGLEREERERGARGQAAVAEPRASVVSPNALREALSQLPGKLYKTGEMNDAGEVLLTLYELINHAAEELGAQGAATGPPLNDAVGLAMREFVYCPSCGKTTHDQRYVQYFINAQATGLREMRQAAGVAAAGQKLGDLLRLMEAETLKSCDTEEGGCDARHPVVHGLERPPAIFTLQLAWQSQQEEPANIAATLAAVSERIDLHSVYRGLAPGAHVYRLRSLVCYYGAHYFALVLLPELQAWAMMDDTKVSRVGTWDDVQRKCVAGRAQPSLLMYEAVK